MADDVYHTLVNGVVTATGDTLMAVNSCEVWRRLRRSMVTTALLPTLLALRLVGHVDSITIMASHVMGDGGCRTRNTFYAMVVKSA